MIKFHCLVAFTLWGIGRLCVVIIFFSVCDVINLRINFGFLIKLFAYMTKMTGQKFKYLENEKSFQHDTKNIFHHFEGLPSIQEDKTIFGRWEPYFKVRISPSQKFVGMYDNEMPLKMMKNAFYLMLKALFVLEIFTFLVNFKIHDIKDWTTNNYDTQYCPTTILPNISRSKGNQVMKFDRSMKWDEMRVNRVWN